MMTTTIECIRHVALVGLATVTACGPGPYAHDDASVDTFTLPDSAPDAVVLPPLPPQGLIVLGEWIYVDAPSASTTDAYFVRGSPLGAPVATDGPCTAYVPYQEGSGSAGLITVTGTSTPITLIPNGSAYGASPVPPTDLFVPDATVHVASAGGADFVAFAGDVASPTDLVFTPPTKMSREAGHRLTWTAGTATVTLIVVYADTASTPTEMICRVPDNGSYTMTASNFALLPTETSTVVVVIGRTQETVIETESGVVTIWAISAVGRDSVTLTP